MQKPEKRFIIAVILFATAAFAVFLIPAITLAQPDVGLNYAANTDLQAASESDIRDLLVNIIKYFITFAGLVAVVFIMYSGFLWMTSNGEPEKIARAKRTLVNSVIGLIVALSAFAIVSFIANLMNGGLSGSGIGNGGNPRVAEGYGVIGSCSVRSVYPEPNQSDVARNYPITITFRDEVDPSTMRDGGNNILHENIMVFHASDAADCLSGGACPSLVEEAQVSTNDNFTFVITPDNYLGSASEVIWYTVYINNNVLDAGGRGIFRNCGTDYLRWSFEVSSRLDLTPPQVKNGGVFPPPDNMRDLSDETTAEQSEGAISVISSPDVFDPAQVSAAAISPPGSPWPGAQVTVDSHCDAPGTYTISLNPGSFNQAYLSRGGISLGSAPTNGSQVAFSYCNITLIMNSGDFASSCGGAACAWTADISAATEADTLSINSTVYVFGQDIEVSANNAVTAGNIAAVLDSNPLLIADNNGNVVELTAANAGSAGDNISVESDSGALEIVPMSGGVDSATTYTPRDLRDKARNAIIQINFNEAVNPLTLSGQAQELSDYIRVKCLETGGAPCTGDGIFDCGGDVCLNGRFEISGQYKTVEFVPDNLCGVNGCGERIYCLPGNSRLEVDINAARLTTCPSPTDCSAKSPYTVCGPGGHCQTAGGENLPSALAPLDVNGQGAADMANNSLDGNRNSRAEGPAGFFDENYPDSGDGDSFRWSFYINDLIDISSPLITALTPGPSSGSASFSDPVRIRFNKLMMNSSLRAGRVRVNNGQNDFYHKAVNIWNYSGTPLGYWIDTENIETSIPPDNEMDLTEAMIRHSDFYENTSYRAQVGSAVKDIYQNCYKPSAYDPTLGAGCNADEASPNCCPVNGALTPVDGAGIDDNGNCL